MTSLTRFNYIIYRGFEFKYCVVKEMKQYSYTVARPHLNIYMQHLGMDTYSHPSDVVWDQNLSEIG